jgi:hypothetical protein
VPVADTATAVELEGALRQLAHGRLRALARWAHPRLVEWLYAEEEHASLRALLRGAVQGAPVAQRLAGLLPTPRLPVRALDELARQATPRDVALRLRRWRHPDAEALLPLTAQAHPGPFEIERALLRAQASRLKGVAAGGDANLRAFAAEQVDLGNAQTALLLAGGRTPPVDPTVFFIDGGRTLGKVEFSAAASAENREAAARVLQQAFAASALSSLLSEGHANAGALELRALSWRLARQRREARVSPLGSAPLLAYLLGLKANLVDLLRLTWGAALGTGTGQLRANLVTPWS